MVAFKWFKNMTLIVALIVVFFGESVVGEDVYIDLMNLSILFLAVVVTIESGIRFYQEKKKREWVGIIGGVFLTFLALSRFT